MSHTTATEFFAVSRKEGVQYFVAGAGALTDKIGSKTSEGTLVWAGAGYSAFAAVAATDETFTVNFVNIYGMHCTCNLVWKYFILI
jgi:hypothetical protein